MHPTRQLFMILCAMLIAVPGHAATIPRPDAPPALAALPANASGLELATALLGIAYREDGVLDEQGRYTTFEPPRKVLADPGLNCSGFVVSAWRYLTGRNITLDEARADANANSGPGSPMGADWDFGFDVLLNLTPGRELAMLDAAGATPVTRDALMTADPAKLRGFSMTDPAAWKAVAGQLKAGELGLVTVSKSTTWKGYTLLHYHVAVLVPDTAGHVWIMHATPKAGAHRLDLATAAGVAGLVKEFGGGKQDDKRALVLRVR